MLHRVVRVVLHATFRRQFFPGVRHQLKFTLRARGGCNKATICIAVLAARFHQANGAHIKFAGAAVDQRKIAIKPAGGIGYCVVLRALLQRFLIRFGDRTVDAFLRPAASLAIHLDRVFTGAAYQPRLHRVIVGAGLLFN